MKRVVMKRVVMKRVVMKRVVMKRVVKRVAMTRLMVALSLLALACGSNPTQIIVEVDADDEVRAAAGILRLQVVGRASEADEFDFTSPTFDDFVRVGSSDWPRRHVLAPQGGDVNRSYMVTAEAISGDFRDLISQARRASGFVDGETRVLRIFLSGADCVGVSCPTTPEATTCEQGLCLEVPMFPADLLPREGEGEMDAGMDATPDAMMDGGEECEQDAPCDTGLLCEEGRIDCSSGAPVCVAAGVKSAGEVCRASVGECDVEETCDGEAPNCPEDALAPVGTECSEGFCNEGVCGACEPGVGCDTGNACETGLIECNAEGVPTCAASGVLSSGTTCRPSAGPCDVPEVCDGSSPTCPTDAFADATTECRSASDLCDVSESCTGSGPACPADAFVAAGTDCRAAEGACDAVEECSGTGPTCPPDLLEEMGTPCRMGSGICDPGEVCDGTEPVCPGDFFAPAGTPCGGTQACDGAGTCTDFGCGTPCSTPNVCEEGIVDCTTGTPTCVGVGPKDAGVECRPADSDSSCDVAERCDGSSVACPPDGFDVGRVCRPAVGPCDAEERCDGTEATCPRDTFLGAATICRESNGACDIAETCNGVGPQCPMDMRQPAGHVCAPSEFPCDLPDVCDGMRKTCPLSPDPPFGAPCVGEPGICNLDLECIDMAISEVLPGGEGFVEIYNRGDYGSLEDCVVSVEPSFGPSFVTSIDDVIDPDSGGFVLFASDRTLDPDWELIADLPRESVAAQVALRCGGTTLDAFAWGSYLFPSEPMPFSATCTMAAAIESSSFERKASASSTQMSMARGGVEEDDGHHYDTQNNCNDFVYRSEPQPQNLLSPPEAPAF